MPDVASPYSRHLAAHCRVLHRCFRSGGFMMQEQQRRSSCDACRRRKVRCDSLQPCRRCVDSGLECTYGSTARRGLSTTYVRSLEQQVAELQRQLQASAHPHRGVLSPYFVTYFHVQLEADSSSRPSTVIEARYQPPSTAHRFGSRRWR